MKRMSRREVHLQRRDVKDVKLSQEKIPLVIPVEEVTRNYEHKTLNKGKLKV